MRAAAPWCPAGHEPPPVRPRRRGRGRCPRWPGTPSGARGAGERLLAHARAAEVCEEGRTRYVKDTPTALVRLGARTAWTLATGQGVVVAVVDTGVADANAHFPDGVVLPGTSFVGGSPRTDPRAHGTAVAGIIAARSIGDRWRAWKLPRRRWSSRSRSFPTRRATTTAGSRSARSRTASAMPRARAPAS